jgi:TolB-like protein
MILPFENMIEGTSGEKLAKGITEDIITDMSGLQGLDVIALSSILSLKETMSDYMDAANELGVKYILYGSLRGDGNTNNIRITAQLYDSKSGNQLWARRYDRVMTDSLKLQDELAILIVQSMAESLMPFMSGEGIQRSQIKIELTPSNSQTKRFH